MSAIPGLPAFLFGKNVVLTITGVIPNALGVLADDTVVGTQYTNGYIDGNDMAIQVLTDNVSPTNSYWNNPVPYEQATRFSFTEFQTAWPLVDTAHPSGWGRGNILLAVASVSTYVRLNVYYYENDISTQIYNWTATCLMTELRQANPKTHGTWTATFQTVLVWDTTTNEYIANPTLTLP